MGASSSIHCEKPFSSATPYAEVSEENIDLLIVHDQDDVRQRHFPGEHNRTEARYDEDEACDRDEERSKNPSKQEIEKTVFRNILGIKISVRYFW